MKLSTLGELPNACAKTNEVLSCHIGGSSHQSLTASDIRNDNSAFIEDRQFFRTDPTLSVGHCGCRISCTRSSEAHAILHSMGIEKY